MPFDLLYYLLRNPEAADAPVAAPAPPAQPLSPADLAPLQGLSGLASQQQLLAEQLRAVRGRQIQPRKYSSPLAAALGGITNLVQGVGGELEQNSLADELRANAAKQAEGVRAGTALASSIPQVDNAALLSSDPAIRAQGQQQVASVIRRSNEVGSALGATGNPALMALSGGLLSRAGSLEGLGLHAGEAALNRDTARERQIEDDKRWAETVRHNQAVESATLGKGEVKETNEGLKLIDPRTGKVRDLLGADGKPLTKAIPGGAAGELSQDAVDQNARYFLATGTMPSIGGGARGAAARTAIANRAAEIGKEQNLATNKAGFGANAASLAQLTKQSDAVDAFEKTAMTNLHTFLDKAKGLVDTGSPLFNLPARAFMEKVAGDPKMAAINTARTVAIQEIGKVLSGATGGAAISDGARHEVEALLKPDASLAQIAAVAEILEKDMANRKAAITGTINDIRTRIGGGPAPAAGGAAQPGAAAGKPVSAYRYSADRKQRIPVYADGSEGAKEPNP